MWASSESDPVVIRDRYVGSTFTLTFKRTLVSKLKIFFVYKCPYSIKKMIFFSSFRPLNKCNFSNCKKLASGPVHRWIQQTRTRGECGGGGGQRRLGGQQWWGGQGQWGRRGRWGWHGWKGWWGLGIFFAKTLRTTKYNNLPNLVRQAQREQVWE